jgi:phospholipid/cholesterol/gamma-HCH transport system substrate-binding protein
MRFLAAIGLEAEQNRTEIVVGLSVVIAVLYLLYAAIAWDKWTLLNTTGYVVYADFASASGLKVGDPVEIAGVEVGKVESIRLADYLARVAFRIQDDVRIGEDAVASVKLEGLIGDRVLWITPGRSEKSLGPGDEIKETLSPLSFQDAVVQVITGDLFSGE